MPYRKPVIGEVEFTSGFGVRSDPFLGRPAMHTGLDFRAATGDPVRATANGKVVSSGWAGGYGRMVEVDHGNGLSTRYGHLSEIHVKVGDVIKIGQVIGAVGSTGRSTGPHLHYETRIDGDAVDPQKFLRAGVRLSSARVDRNGTTVRLHRVLATKPEKVFRAFLDAEAMAKWLPPYGFTCKVHHFEAKVGGTFRMSFSNFTTNTGHSFGGEYLEIVPNERIRYTDRFDDPNLPGVIEVTVTAESGFAAEPKSTSNRQICRR